MAEQILVIQEKDKEQKTELDMPKKIPFESKVTTIDSYVKGEKFHLTLPEEIIDLELRLGKRHYRDLRWNPWPKERNVIRRMGRFLLKKDTNFLYLDSYWDDKTRTYKSGKRPFLLVAEADENGEPIEWLRFDRHHSPNEAAENLEELGGPSINQVVCELLQADKEFFDSLIEELEEENRRWVAAENLKAGYEKYQPDYKTLDERTIRYRLTQTERGQELAQKLKTEQDELWELYKPLLEKVFGKGKGLSNSAGGYFYGHDSRETRAKIFLVELEWYRKHLMKLQRKQRRERKKQVAAERGVDLSTLVEEKKERKRMERRVKRTQEWVKVSKDVHNSIDWLQEFVRRMGNFEKIDQEWFDENRRELRELATKMKPLSRVLND